MTERGEQEPIVRRALEGDRSAFDELFRALEDRLRAFIRSRIRSGYRGKLDVEEVLQDTFVRAFQSIGSFRGEDREQLRRWLTGVAQKTVLRAETELAARRRRTLEIQDDVASSDVSPSRALRREERLERLRRVIDTLSGDHREVVYLTRIEGLTLKQAAARMGRSPEAVRKLFWRALKQLRGAFPDTGSLRLPDRGLERAERGQGAEREEREAREAREARAEREEREERADGDEAGR
ncbi:MAG: RNA polymerase sigma factor [Planctomycetes bacterium]|nr:RNA polymerase sigma factor [Planctomycetota bacterium]